jgi:hypothetical protein
LSHLSVSHQINVFDFIFNLLKKELAYLRSNETLKLPEPPRSLPAPKPDVFGQVDSDECWSSDWSDEDEEIFENPIPELCKS